MSVSPEQLAALVAVVDEGTFEAAARSLHVTPSAVSQRIRALEVEVGRVVVVRSVPCRPTAAGESVLRMARQHRLLETELAAELQIGTGGPVELAVAVNADSAGSWFTGVMAACADWPEVTLRLHVHDQQRSAEMLRAGTVLGAVTADPTAVQGCSTTPLLTMRYTAAATRGLVDRHRRGRSIDLTTMPLVRFSTHDDLQQHVLDRRGVTVRPPTHVVPDSAGFEAAVRVGLGWGVLLPDQLRRLHDDDVVPLGRDDHVDVPLYWQRWRLPSSHLDRLTALVTDAARAASRPAARATRRTPR